jgi:chorismate-pyruvate lyase
MRMSALRASVMVALLLSLAGRSVRGQPADAFRLAQALNDKLLASRSATQVLAAWCGDQHLASDPTIVAHRVLGIDKPADAEQRRRLRVSTAETVSYRHVRLQCGTRVLSEADNWYVPGRLTATMNRLLETTETSFGTVVRPLEPSRETLAVTMFWKQAADAEPVALFAHRAVLFTRDHVPFSEVYEVYQRQALP